MLHTILSFLAALTILIAIHEFGHYWVARRFGVKVLRFSLGFGKPLWSYRQSKDTTEFTVSAIPLGGYVRMVDEREGPVGAADLPYAFNRQPLFSRFSIVAAGPLFNFLLALLLYWFVYMIGETGLRPVLGEVPAESLAAQSGFRPGDEIAAVGDHSTPTWNEAISQLMEEVLDVREVPVTVRTPQGEVVQRILTVPSELAESPDKLYDRLGLLPWQPELEAIVDRVEPNSAAEQSGLRPGDRIVSAEGEVLDSWQQWVKYVRSHPEVKVHFVVDREGVDVPLEITPAALPTPSGAIGRIGASVRIPPEVDAEMRVTYRLGAVPAIAAAWDKTLDYSALTLKMIGRMIIGKAALENLSGPLSIAQYAGASARLGLVQFLKFLAAVSVSLAVLNLLPIPVLDGGHLALYTIEAVKGSPLSERTVMICQQIGLFILISLMSVAFYLDLERLFS
jgi:regulator of sigma E protease